MGEGVYAGGGSLDGTVKAFIPGRSGRLVAGAGLASTGDAGLEDRGQAGSGILDVLRDGLAKKKGLCKGLLALIGDIGLAEDDPSDTGELIGLCDGLLMVLLSFRKELSRDLLGRRGAG